ncbi:MAG TPA: hypothetical protein VH643_20920 [Gemmataceae bacterium]|jgi:hypothetical protein
MREITEQQRQALDASPNTPARVSDLAARRVEVLLTSDDFDWIRQLLGDEPDAPRLTDPRTNTIYALLPEERYERFKAFFEEDPFSAAERRALLREAGKRAGWDAPEADDADSSEEP